jgi:hypothetical protein
MSDEARKNAIRAIKRYKSGWLGVGKSLFEVKLSGSWKDWGYEKFYDYCKEELGLTPMTANDMMAAYEYIKINEPSVLNTVESNPDAYIPDYHTVASLSKAANKNKIKVEKEDEVRDVLFNADEDTMVKANKQAKDILSESDKKDGSEIMDDIRKKTNSIKKRVKKLNSEIHNTSSFPNDVQETSDKLNEMVSKVEI